jgi:hypothetical protein
MLPLFFSLFLIIYIHTHIHLIAYVALAELHPIDTSNYICVVTTEQHLAAFVFVPSGFGEKFPTAEF